MIIRDKDKQALTNIFSEIPFPVEIWAFGSRVDGTAHSGSDLDLVIRTHDLSPIPLTTLQNLKETIRESTIPILVELHDWARIPEYFHKNIATQYEVFFTNIGEFERESFGSE
jgi:predicted nucleotidyltransferase